MTWFVYNALVSLPHSVLFTHTFILCRCGGFFLIGPGLGPFPPLSDSPFYIVELTALTSLLTECYYSEQNKLEPCYPVKHISLFSELLASTQTVHCCAFCAKWHFLTGRSARSVYWHAHVMQDMLTMISFTGLLLQHITNIKYFMLKGTLMNS